MKEQHGFMNIFVGLIALVIIGGGAMWYVGKSSQKNDAMGQDAMHGTMENAMVEDGMQMEDTVMEGDASSGTMLADSDVTYTGNVLAGTESKLLEFNQDDYNKAIAAGKVVLLYFYADWCPTCKAEQPAFRGAFNKLKDKNVVAFRVNYKDNFTDENEEALARQFGVAYQHTKVFVRGGTMISKHPDQWDEARYIKEVNAVLAAQ